MSVLDTRPIQYYATHDALPPGRVLMFNGDWYWPQTIFLHPDDLAMQNAILSQHCRLIHIRDWTPTHGQQRRAWQEVIDCLREIGI